MKPLPWSYSGLNMFVNCPAQYNEVKVKKSVKETKGEAIAFGEYVHKQFELWQKNHTKLPRDLAHHELVMKELAALAGDKFLEQRVALNRALRPVDFFADDVWTRGVIDFLSIAGSVAYIVDYKTGRRLPTNDQLALCALHVFATYPNVQECMTWYYMTQCPANEQPGWKVFRRAEIPELWARFIPDLKQYAEAFRTDTWQYRTSGLCRGFCPVKHCQHWRPKREDT